jgi:hypothetical protein
VPFPYTFPFTFGETTESDEGCVWPVDLSCLPALPTLGGDPTSEEQAVYDTAVLARANAESLAVQVMWALSGRQFGVCSTAARPCPEYARGYGYNPYVAVLDADSWVSWPCGCVGSCTVTGPRVVHLPGPVVEVTAVTVAGMVLDPGDYQLEGDALYRAGGVWPRQDLGRPLGEDGTWSVTYLRGIPVPAGVDTLTGVLAKEFIAACDDEGSCRLPRTVVSTSRRGVSHDFDPSKILAAGKTGLAEVDLWLSAVNPHRLAEPPMVL